MLNEETKEEIASYLIEEFGKNELQGIRQKKVISKWKEYAADINARGLGAGAYETSYRKYIPTLEMLIISQSHYTKQLISDVDSIYIYLWNYYHNQEEEEPITTIKTISCETKISTYARINECLYYLSRMHVTNYSENNTGTQIKVDENRQIYLNCTLYDHDSFTDYLNWFNGIHQKHDVQTNTINLGAYTTNLLEILIDVKEKYFDNRTNPIGREKLFDILENEYNITTENNRISIYNVLSPHKK